MKTTYWGELQGADFKVVEENKTYIPKDIWTEYCKKEYLKTSIYKNGNFWGSYKMDCRSLETFDVNLTVGDLKNAFHVAWYICSQSAV